MRSFHANVNGDDKAAVPGWEGNRRIVAFRSPVNAPAMLKSLIGSEFIDVQDTQTFQANENGSFRVESKPIPNVPGASNFSSTAVLLICNEPGQRSCTIHGTVSCSASGPWGLINTVETFMAREAHNVLKRFLEYCRSQIISLSSDGTLPSLLAAAPPSPLTSRLRSSEIEPAEAQHDEANFYDAEETEFASLASEKIGLLDRFTEASTAETAEERWEVVVQNLNFLKQSGEETNLLLRSIDSKLSVLLSSYQQGKVHRQGWSPSQLALGIAVSSSLTIGILFWMKSRSNGLSRL